MKLFLSAVLLMGLFATGCGKAVPDDRVAGEVGQAMCAKLKECGPSGAFDAVTCEAGLKNSYLAALGFTGKKGKVRESQLKACLADIQAMKCETFAEFSPPKACTFLKK